MSWAYFGGPLASMFVIESPEMIKREERGRECFSTGVRFAEFLGLSSRTRRGSIRFPTLASSPRRVEMLSPPALSGLQIMIKSDSSRPRAQLSQAKSVTQVTRRHPQRPPLSSWRTTNSQRSPLTNHLTSDSEGFCDDHPMVVVLRDESGQTAVRECPYLQTIWSSKSQNHSVLNAQPILSSIISPGGDLLALRAADNMSVE